MISRYLAALVLLSSSGFAATVDLWVDDASGVIGKVDVATGAVTLVGSSGVTLTDIAFSPTGLLYGIDFSNLYSINTTTGAATLIGSLGVAGTNNALVFGPDGTLYEASDQFYTVNTATGHATSVGSIGFASGGDLAFVNGTLFLATADDKLVTINKTTGAGTLVGPIGIPNVFGLATPGNGVLYGVAGTGVYVINTTTGAGVLDVNYGGQGLGNANGESFITEATPATPEPGSIMLLGGGLLFLARRLRGFARS